MAENHYQLQLVILRAIVNGPFTWASEDDIMWWAQKALPVSINDVRAAIDGLRWASCLQNGPARDCYQITERGLRRVLG